MQEHLPDERRSRTHRFQVGDRKGYIIVGYYENGSPGEVQIVIAKSGEPERSLWEAVSILVSLGLQYGVPLQAICEKLQRIRDVSGGWTGSAEIPQAASVIDYVFQWLALPRPGPLLWENNTKENDDEHV